MASLLLVSVPLPVAAALPCGSTITTNTTLTGDVTCLTNLPGLIIGASFVTLDCAGNVITGIGAGVGPGFSNQAGIQVIGFDHVKVKNCTVKGFAVGIGLFASSALSTIEGNFAHDNAVGIALEASSSNTIKSNVASSNLNIGILVECGSSGCISEPAASNHVKFNIADSNGAGIFPGFGYQDLTFGSKTAGTANTYLKDECSFNKSGGSLPTGLCTPQP